MDQYELDFRKVFTLFGCGRMAQKDTRRIERERAF